MKKKSAKLSTTPMAPFHSIRVETELVRFPFHNLGRGDNSPIVIKQVCAEGKKTLWKITPNSEFGMPGEVAYQIDTRIVNKAIDELGSDNIDKGIALGSLREIARIVGGTKDTERIKRAFLQNALAGVQIEIEYKDKNGEILPLAVASTRYAVYFRGERMPNGKLADQVYVVLHEWYRKLLQSVKRRPLDYDYIGRLRPAAQRFYELISFKMFAAIKFGHPHVRLRYSEFCERAPLKRQASRKSMNAQMYRILLQHRENHYLQGYHFELVANDADLPDWDIVVLPGKKAIEEFDYFNKTRQTAGVSQVVEADTLLHATLAQDIPAPDSPSQRLVRLFHFLSRGVDLADVSGFIDDLATIDLELQSKEEALVEYWLRYSFREAQKTNYNPATVRGILKYREEAYLDHHSQQRRRQRREVTKAKSVTERAESTSKRVNVSITPELLEQAEESLKSIKGALSENRFVETVRAKAQKLAQEQLPK